MTFYHVIDFIADSPKFGINFLIRKTDNGKSALFQISGSFTVIFRAIRRIMLQAVRLNHEFGADAVEIRDKAPNRGLTAELYGMSSQEVIP